MDNETKRKFDAAMSAYLQSGDEAAYVTLVQMFEDKEQEILALHRKLAAETLRADQGWTRYEEANRDRNNLRQQMAGNSPLDKAQKASSPFATWWAMVEAENELAGEILKPEAVVLSFMGSGASMNVTVKQITSMLDAIFECEDGKPTRPDNCEICHGKKGGVRGNENIIDGKTVCDYCHADGSYKS